MAKSAVSMNPTREDFEALLAESYLDNPGHRRRGCQGPRRCRRKRFRDHRRRPQDRRPRRPQGIRPARQGRPSIKVGDTVEVYLERIENALGEAVLSRDKARREEAWTRLEEMSAKNERVDGVIFGRVKGGFTVDLGGAVAFLPG